MLKQKTQRFEERGEIRQDSEIFGAVENKFSPGSVGASEKNPAILTEKFCGSFSDFVYIALIYEASFEANWVS